MKIYSNQNGGTCVCDQCVAGNPKEWCLRAKKEEKE